MFLRYFNIVFLAGLLLTSCKKKEVDSLKPEEIKVIIPNPKLQGIWKLIQWDQGLFNNKYCDFLAYYEFDAADSTNVLMEITDYGVINYFENDTLNYSYALTGYGQYENSYEFNFGNYGFYFYEVNKAIDSLELGDTIMISAPDFDGGFVEGIYKFITLKKYYIKVE